MYLFDESGKRYLDFAAGIAVNSLGHCHPALVAALQKQAATLWHCSNMYQMPGLTELSQRLVDATFADTVFFCSSGAEAVECGLKMLRRYHDAKGQNERYRVITVEGSFHGRTLAGIAASGNPRVTEGYEPLMDGFDQVPFGDLDAAANAITPETAAILLEVVQGEGGIRPMPKDYVQGLRALADKYGLLLFFDEVQCGMGRTGHLFAFEHYGVTPDICSVAKGIGSGFPVGACLATERAASGMTPGSHGSTYGSNPLAISVASAVMDIMLHETFFAHTRDMGDLLLQELAELAREYPHIIKEVRGLGLMIGLVTEVTNTDLIARLRTAGLLTAAAWNNVIRVMPPLIIEPSHIKDAVAILRSVCKNWH